MEIYRPKKTNVFSVRCRYEVTSQYVDELFLKTGVCRETRLVFTASCKLKIAKIAANRDNDDIMTAE